MAAKDEQARGWRRSGLKKEGRKALKGNYLRAAVICLLLAIFAGGVGLSSAINTAGELQSVNFRRATNTEIVDAIISGYYSDSRQLWQEASRFSNATKGIAATVFNNITRTGSPVFGTLNAVNQIFFQDQIGAGITIFFGAVFTALYHVFITNPLRVGGNRFFMENRNFPATKIERILFLFKIRRVRSTAWTMLCRTVFTWLWALTIAGGFIKGYAYRMIPFIIAENPSISRKRAFMLSAAMMRGNKWRAFKLDVSFAGWYLLSLVTGGIFGIVYLNPYKNAVDAELYMRLRQELTARHRGTRRYFNDLYLKNTVGTGEGEYPVELYPIPDHPSRNWMSVDYRRSYSFSSLVLIFFVFAMVGWVWEVFVDLLNTGHFVNRGTLYGPWLPIYGCGGLIAVLLLRHVAKHPLLTFGVAVAAFGVLEYATSWALETFLGARWWEYRGYFMNLNGRVCLEGLVVFGLGGCLGVYYLAPMMDDAFKKIPRRPKRALCGVLLGLFATDLVLTNIFPNMTAGTPVG